MTEKKDNYRVSRDRAKEYFLNFDQESFIPYPHALIDLIFQRRKFLFPHLMTELQEYDK